MFCISGKSQEVVTAVGGELIGSGGFVSNTIGQIFFHTLTDNSGTVSQGVQHPHELVIVQINTGDRGNICVLAYPNPATDRIILRIESEDINSFKTVHYQLFDSGGMLIKSNPISDSETQIRLEGLLSSAYFLKIIEGTQVIRTFKIILN